MRDLVLVGGGHAHVRVLASFGRRPIEGVQVTLIARDIRTPYSGMIPGFVAGHYSFDDCHIDLAALCARTGARLVHGEAVGLDRTGRQVLLSGQAPVAYDLLSLDVGAAPDLDAIPGAAEHAVPVKPIAEFGQRWLAFVERAHAAMRIGAMRIVVIGGGAGGAELALAINHRLPQANVVLATRDELLAGHAASARKKMRAILARRGIRLIEKDAARSVETGGLQLASGERLEADAVFVVTEATAPRWLAGTGLQLDPRRFVAVAATLRSSDPRIFAAGDCATMLKHPRPKSGVFAVRQGPPLADNLRRTAAGENPKPFTPQSRYLALIGTGDGRALATRGSWAIEGAWVWRWKDYIDRRWMARYR
jgi:selenide,water dikinase